MRSETAEGHLANDHLWVTMSFDGGAVATHEGSWSSAAANHFKGIAGTEGALYTDEWGNDLYWCKRGQKERQDVDPDEKFDLRGNFLDSIERGDPCLADAAWGLKVMRLVEAIRASAVLGQAVSIDNIPQWPNT